MITTNLAVSTPIEGVAASLPNNNLSTFSSPFEALLKSGFHEISIDLSNASLTTVLSTFEEHKKKISPKYSNSSLLFNIKKLETLYNCVIMPYHVSAEFYSYFKAFLLDKGLRPSTIQNYFDTLRSALKFAGMHRAQLSETYTMFKVEAYERTKVALTPSELAHIYYFDIDANKEKIYKILKKYPLRGFSFRNLKRVQAQFVLGANIGQRYSDAKRLSRDNFDETGTVYKTVQQKTGGHAKVNILKHSIDKDVAFDILKQCDYEAPTKKMCLSNFNRYLHILCQAIGREFNKIVVSENKINGVIVKEEVPKWKLITSHTARRSFITYLVTKEKTTIPEVQHCSGHKDLRQLSKYVVIED